MDGSHALVEAIRRERVNVMFGIPGGANIPLCDVLYESPIRWVLARHEQCAAHMAEGYARASGAVGVCVATSGPGATNLVTGIADAYMDSTPIVAFTGQVPRAMVGMDAFQEADIIGISTPVTKYNFQPRSANEIPEVVKKAFYLASTGRPGPVLVDLPKDVQTEVSEIEFPEKVVVRGYRPNRDPDPLQVKKAAEMLLEAERPVILAGGGVVNANATAELVSLAEYLLTPVETTLMGKGAFPENHPLSLGLLGMHGTRMSNAVTLEADLILAVGMRFSDRTTGNPREFAAGAKIIHMDIDSAEIGKNIRADHAVVSDAKKGLRALLSAVAELAARRQDTVWSKRVRELKDQLNGEGKTNSSPLSPPKLMKHLRELLPSEGIVTTEVGQNQMWAALHFQALTPRTYITSGGLGTMGFGFPAALGAKVAKPSTPVVDIAGDGSFIMTEQELATSVVEKIPVLVTVLNNSVLGMVAQWQRLFYNRRYFGVNLKGVPDFAKLADAYGAEGRRVESYGDFRRAVAEAVRSEVTTVIDIPISPEENVFPMIPPGKSLKDMLWE